MTALALKEFREVIGIATIALLQSWALRDVQAVAEQLEEALNSRTAVEQAKGVLAQRLGIGMDEAFSRLRGFARARQSHLTAVALEVVRMVARWLPVAVADGGDLEARSQMLLAAHMAGLAFGTTGLGLCHAIGHALSARLGVAHGAALAAALPHVLAFNAPGVPETDAEVAALTYLHEPIKVQVQSLSPNAPAKQA